MKITYISASIVPSRYANSVHVMKMCQALSSWGHDVTLIAQYGDRAVTDPFEHYGVVPNFSLVRLPRRILGPLGALEYTYLLRSTTKQSSADIYYARYIHGALAVARDNIPIVFESHAPPQSHLARLQQRVLFQLRVFRRLVVISDALRQMYIDAFPDLDPGKIVVAHDGADLPVTFRRPSDDPGQGADRITVGYVGGLYKGRGVELIGKLADRFPQIEFHIVGGTNSEMARWQTVLTQRNVVWHGFVAHGELQSYYDQFDIVLAPYQHAVGLAKAGADTSRYMSPLKIFEYMAQGKAMIASDLPVLREVLKHEENCLLCKPDDIDEWASAVSRLIEDEHLRRKIGSEARSSLEAQYTWRARAKAVLANIGV